MSKPSSPAVLHDRYELGDELGRGGMGVVYRAHDSVLDRDVAVKVLNPSGLGTEGRARMLREAQAVAKLNHPNIVTVHDAGELDGSPYIVMELVEGASLHEHPTDGFESLLAMARDVSAALEHAHSLGIIHRDLKPENVILALDGTAKLMDFGLARSMATRVSVEGEIVGTVFYLAPEVAMGQDIDGRADLYSLGVILYEQAAGELPFIHDDPLAVVSQHIHATVFPPRAKNPEIPPVLEELILQLLSKDPEDRPESASALLKLLDNPDLLDPEAETEKELSVIARIARGRFVARQSELEQAKSVWSKAQAGNGQTLLISGEPGIGKTRLVRELSTHVELSGGRTLIGECYSEGGAPYAPFAQVIRSGLRGVTRNGFEVPEFVMADLLTMAPELRPYYSDVEPNPQLEPDAEQQRLFENVVSFCDELADHSPVMIVIDDAHWGDSGSLSMLRHLARRTRNQRILLVATYREVDLDVARPFHEVLLDINKARLATRLKLERLTRDQTKDLLAAIFEDDITEEFLDGIYKETEGNPFFVEEVCKALVEEGKLYYEDGEWHRPSMDELEIPQSVRVAIQTRVARLPEEYQDVLSMAAILGREFEFEVLNEASDADEDVVIDALEAAEDAQLIEETGQADEDRFIFVHALIPLALLDSVRKLRRRKLHRRAAAALEALHPEDYEQLAHHYFEAGDDQRALAAYIKAGEQASEAYANKEAENHFKSALDLVEESGLEADLRAQLGNVLARSGHFEEASEVWAKGIEIYLDLGDMDKVALLYARSAKAATDSGNQKRGMEVGRLGLEVTKDAEDGPGLADLYHEAARALFFNGERKEGYQTVTKAMEMAEKVGAQRVQIEAMISHGSFSYLPLDESRDYLERAAELAKANGLPSQESRARNNLCVIYGFGLGQMDRAREQLAMAKDLANSMGLVELEVFYGANFVMFGVWQGDFESADEQYAELIRMSEEIGASGAGLGLARSYRAALWRFLGRTEMAIDELRVIHRESLKVSHANAVWLAANYLTELLLEINKDLEDSIEVLKDALSLSYGGDAWPQSQLAMVYARSGDLGNAHAHLELALKADEEDRQLIDKMWLALAEAYIAVAQDGFDQASHAYQRAIGIAEQCGMRWYRAYYSMDLASVLTALDQNQEAAALLKEAAQEFDAMDVAYYQEIASSRMAGLEA